MDQLKHIKRDSRRDEPLEKYKCQSICEENGEKNQRKHDYGYD